ncbi:MAG: Mur ligase family protein [Polyangiaceae bacterium]
MRLVDARRLTGPSHLAERPLVLVDLALDPGERVDACVDAYVNELSRIRDALGLPARVAPIVLPPRRGALVAYEAPIDTMLAFAEMSEWAGESAAEVVGARDPLPLEPKQAEVAEMLAQLSSPRLLALAAEAGRRGLPLLWDDERVSVGLGARSVCFARSAIPEADAVAWDAVDRVPVAMITGTNGKTTCTRLLARIAAEAGHVVGSTSSEGITIAGVEIDKGDWTGPAAARTVLRDPRVTLGVLETARGGILRRGLALDRCDAALITNVSGDHVGLEGVDDVAAMTRVKSVIARAVPREGTVVLNARDANLVALARNAATHGISAAITYFADLERGDAVAAEVIARHVGEGHSCVVARAGHVVFLEGDVERPLLSIASIPITVGGKARYNVENALAAAAMARALGLDPAAIERGLEGFAVTDNPGRGQLVEKGGVRIMLDFGHNPEAVRAVMRLVSELRGPSGELDVIAGCAGDRSDEDFDAMAEGILEARPRRVFLRDLPGYLRGRAPGEVPARFRDFFTQHGMSPDRVTVADSEVDALERALADAKPGDFVVLLVHLDHDAVGRFLAS